jgi:cytochrome d ubiquinol oxidase subunit I
VYDWFDALFLSRLQFAFTISFHFIFPSFTIGLASYLTVLNALWLKTGNAVYGDLYTYWSRIFAIVFGMGVVSGVVMSYQFGTNWSVFSERAGPVVGPLMAYEVMTAFFLEAGFLGVMLFGRSRVGPGLHFLATCMVAIGTLVSTTWIIAVNSWMQTPQGFAMNEAGQFVPADWGEIIFNPSFFYRLPHTVLASYLTTAFVVGAVGAWHLLRDRTNPGARKMFSMAMWMAVLVTPVQMFVGDAHGRNTLEHQVVKLLAIEGDFEPSPDGAHLVLFGWPSNEEGRVLFQIAIPKLGSLILKHDMNAPMPGLTEFPKEDWPPVAVVFWSFRIMVGMAVLMLGVGLWSLLARRRGNLYEATWLHRVAVVMGPSGFVTVIAGWVTTEVGRQPWTVYGLMRTAESHSPVEASAVATSLLAFVIVYFLVFGAGIFYILRLMSRAPGDTLADPPVPVRAAGITPASSRAAPTSPDMQGER